MDDTWKVPIAYVLLNAINAKQNKNLIFQCLQAFHESDVLIISLTCDGSSTNLTVLHPVKCQADKIIAFKGPIIIVSNFYEVEDDRTEVLKARLNVQHSYVQNQPGPHRLIF